MKREPVKISSIVFIVGVILLFVLGLYLYGQAKGYSYLSDDHVKDLMRSKLFALAFILIAFFVIYWKREKPYAPALAVFLLSVYFVILYGYLFRGTEYGMNGHWGDNGNRLAEICKMMAYNTFFTDWYLKDLTSFYPPLWFYLMALYAKLLSIEAYQTIKYGYLLIFTVYPWLLYGMWKKVVSKGVAAAVTIATIFFAYKYLDWIYYEHITIALFIPWWLYYFENEPDKKVQLANWKFYAGGGVIGGLLFMTYYYWFFMALLALPVTLGYRFHKNRSFPALKNDIYHKIILMAAVGLVSAVYWIPLLRSIYWLGMSSSQNVWFGTRHANLLTEWTSFSWEGLFIVAGVFFSFFLFDRFNKGKLLFLFLGGMLLIIIDRIMNLDNSSFQSRKIFEFVHVMTIIPLAIGVWQFGVKKINSKKLLLGCTGLLFFIAMIISNSQTEIYHGKKYQLGLKQTVPVHDLSVFKAVDVHQKVFLTTHYLEACYLPYYLFIPLNNMTAHTAGRISQRELFLEHAVTISEPDMLAYVLYNNRYSGINYVYLPENIESKKYELTIYTVRFNSKAEPKTYTFTCDIQNSNEFFVKKHDNGLYKLNPPVRSAEFDKIIKDAYPDIYWHLTPLR